MTIIADLKDAQGNDLALGDAEQYSNPQTLETVTAVLTWSAEFGQILLADPDTGEECPLWPIGASGLTKVDALPSPSLTVSSNGRLVTAPGFVLSSVPIESLGLEFQLKGEILGIPIYCPMAVNQ